MTTRRAACSCGQLHLAIEGEPMRISMCHCLECQRRTGAVISNQARFRREQITFAGEATEWTRTAESGNALTFRFCPVCGSTVYWTGASFPALVAVAIGTFADANFPAPTVSVWEECRHSWVALPLMRGRGARGGRGESRARPSPQTLSPRRAGGARAGKGGGPVHLATGMATACRVGVAQAASSRASSFSNSRRNRLASLSGSQLAICGKMVR
jgi:hypothetical protein